MSEPNLSEHRQNFSAFAETLRLALENGKSKSSALKENIAITLDKKAETESASNESKQILIKLSKSKRSLSLESKPSTLVNPTKAKTELLSKREKVKKRKDEKKEKESTSDKTTIKTLENYLKIARDKNSELTSQLISLQQSQDFIEGGKRHSEIRDILRKAILEAKEKTQENEKLKNENIRLRKMVENLTFKLHGTTGDSVYYGGHYSEADS
ncbi:hypothetical protein D3C87_563980 [compost metagenome]